MNDTIFGLFDSLTQSEQAIQELNNNGIRSQEVSLDDEHFAVYSDYLRNGGILVAVRGDQQTLAAAETILQRHGAHLERREAVASADEPGVHYEVEGTFARGQSDQELIEATDQPEGSFATGQATHEPVGEVAPPPAQAPDNQPFVREKGSFATGQAGSQEQIVEASNEPEDSYAKGQRQKERGR